MGNTTRRSFIAGAALAGMTGLTCASAMANIAFADEVEWADEADFVIVGSGAAGYSAAVTCALEGLGTALVLEAAPYDLRGGNSRVCGQGTFCPKSVEACLEYQTDLNKPYVIDPELMQAWAENICQNGDWLINEVGADIYYKESAEFPEAPCADMIGHYASNVKRNDEGSGGIWAKLEERIEDFGIPVLFDARAICLIHDPATKEVKGVTTEDGRNFKARKAVILASGGFEWNKEMMDEHNTAGFVDVRGIGTTYNRGDMIIAAQALGAQLWHMNNFSGKSCGVRICAADDDEHIAGLKFSSDLHDFIFVDPSGKRYMYEEARGLARHGKVYEGGTWADLRYPGGGYAIFCQASYDKLCIGGTIGFTPYMPTIQKLKSNDELLAAGIITKSENYAELAAAIGVDEAAIAATIENYNAMVAAGGNDEYHRGQPLSEEGALPDANATSRGAADVQLNGFDLTPLEPPFYSAEMRNYVINSQGGPKRDATGNIVDVFGNPIPRLYGAGEGGCIYAYKYNVGGNFSEAISSGRMAMRNAAKLEAWA